MATYTETLATLLAEITAMKAQLASAVAASEPMKEFRLLQEIGGLMVAVDPAYIRWMQHGAWKNKDGTIIPAVKVMYAANDEGGQRGPQVDIFPGSLLDIAQQLGVKLKQVIVAPPGPLNPPAPVAQDLDLEGVTARVVVDQVETPNVVSVAADASAAPRILVVKNWEGIDAARDHWTATRDADGALFIQESHGSGFTIRATGFIGFSLDGDDGFVTVSSI